MKNNIKQTDAMVLRKLREIKGLSRKESAILLGISHKAVEKFENGRTILKKNRIDKTLSAYGLTYEDFLLCYRGKIKQIEKKFENKKEKDIDDKKIRRFFKKIITKEVQVLTALRKLKNFSQYKASFVCGYHERAISNIEGGRVKLSRLRIQHIVQSYGFKMKDFEHHMKSEILVTEIQDECISIIKGLCEKNLKAVHPLLLNFK